MTTTLSSATISTTTDSGNYAGFWLRFVASFIDVSILICPMTVMSFLVDLVVGKLLGEAVWWERSLVATVIYLTFYYLTLVPYYAVFESSPLQATPGKLALGLIVTDLEGNRISLCRAVLRNAGKILSDLTIFGFYVGYLLAAFTEKKQALHDLTAQCLVVRKMS